MPARTAYCEKCGRNHRLYSPPWIRCFGIVAQDCNLYHNNNTVTKVFCTDMIGQAGDTLRTIVDRYEYLCGGSMSVHAGPGFI